jgi:hypothetical protein
MKSTTAKSEPYPAYGIGNHSSHKTTQEALYYPRGTQLDIEMSYDAYISLGKLQLCK